MTLHDKALRIKAIVLDIDGVLTDGKIGYGCGSDEEIKFFHVRDGHGIVLARRAGLRIGILSGRASAANERRAKELKLDFLYTGILDKKEGIELLLKDQGLAPEECMYIGDDIVDARPMAVCGLAVAVGDAVPELDRVADLRTRHNGGCGAVREAIEFLLKEQGRWDSLMTRYFDL
jgi:3-deoxy-D-manno-octulosonate 8-phosphate phosphatase, yrbI family